MSQNAKLGKPLGPGATIGIIGGGQLARMTAMEARRMGYRIAVLDPDPECGASPLCDHLITAALDDVEAARRLALASDVITVDTEHVPAELLAQLEELRPVRPGSEVLRVVQDRLSQRQFIERAGIAQPLNASVVDETSLRSAAELIGFPCVLKTRRSGYDGKGQVRAQNLDELIAGWQAIDKPLAVLEAFIDFECEISVVLCRGEHGEVRVFPVVENEHRKHVLHLSQVPARVPDAVAVQAIAMATELAVAFQHVGTLAVEFFLTREHTLLVNEIAPRTHNSGHFTLGACATSQFEQHVRAICGLALGDSSLLRPAAMVNLMGELWQHGEPNWAPLLEHPSARLHLYGKGEARPGRKMGHALFFAEEGGGEPATVAAAQLARALAPPVRSGRLRLRRQARSPSD